MEYVVRKSAVLCLGFSAILSFSLFTLGCSSDNAPAAKTDAGKRDTGSGSGGSGGSGGSSATGGSNGSGGASASGGSSGTGGSGGSGGSSASGGASGSGGSSASGGSGGSGNAGGSGGSGGSGGGGTAGSGGSGGTGGAGGTSTDDAGSAQVDGGESVDTLTSDAEDAPILGNDDATSETGASDDGGTPPVLDTGSQDTENLDSQAIDTTMVFLDAEIDTAVVDSALAVDTADGAAVACIQQIVNAGYSSGVIAPCSSCHDNSIILTTQCENMITCLLTSGPLSGPCTGSGSCHTNCLNGVGGSAVVDTCVTNLVSDACN
jgi:hypothetical protein